MVTFLLTYLYCLSPSQRWWGDLTDRDTAEAMPTGCQLGHMYRGESMLKFLVQRAKSLLTFTNDWRTCQDHYSIVKFGVSHVKGSGKGKMTSWVGHRSAMYMCLIWHPLACLLLGFHLPNLNVMSRDKNWRLHGFKMHFSAGCLMAVWGHKI